MGTCIQKLDTAANPSLPLSAHSNNKVRKIKIKIFPSHYDDYFARYSKSNGATQQVAYILIIDEWKISMKCRKSNEWLRIEPIGLDWVS